MASINKLKPVTPKPIIRDMPTARPVTGLWKTPLNSLDMFNIMSEPTIEARKNAILNKLGGYTQEERSSIIDPLNPDVTAKYWKGYKAKRAMGPGIQSRAKNQAYINYLRGSVY